MVQDAAMALSARRLQLGVVSHVIEEDCRPCRVARHWRAWARLSQWARLSLFFTGMSEPAWFLQLGGTSDTGVNWTSEA